MATIDTRVISGQGVLKCPYDNADIKKAKVLTFFCDLIRPPSLFYSNKHYNPNRAQYATLCFMRDGYVISAVSMQFPSQVFEYAPDISAQALYAVKCSYAGILQTFGNLASLLSLPLEPIVNGIEDWTTTLLYPDTVLVVCEADAAIQIVAKSTEFKICEDDTSTPPPPPPPPPPPTKYPKGSRFDDPNTSPISPPYDPPDDGGETVPFNGDVVNNPGPPDPPNPGQGYNVVVYYEANSNPELGRTTNQYVFGFVTLVRSYFDGSEAHLQVYCYGTYPGTPLSSPTWIDIVQTSSNPNRFGNPSIVSCDPL